MTRDLAVLALANVALLAAGHGVLRLIGIRPAADRPAVVARRRLRRRRGRRRRSGLGAARRSGSRSPWWQLLLLCAACSPPGLARRGRSPLAAARSAVAGWLRLLPAATLVALAILAVDLAVQPIWTDDAWSIWAIKAVSIVELGGLDPAFLGSASVVSADYPLVVPVLELVAYRFCGLPNELVPLQLGLVFLAFPWALAALLRDRVRPLLLWVVVLAIALAPSLQIQTASAVADITLAVFFALAGVAAWRWVEDGERDAALAGGCLLRRRGRDEGGGRSSSSSCCSSPWRSLRGDGAVRSDRSPPWSRRSWRPRSRGSSGHERHGLGNAFSDSGGVGASICWQLVDRIPRAAASIARELAHPSSWLALVALAVAAIVLALWRPAGRGLAVFTLFVTLSSLAALVAIYWTTPLDFDYHVATSVRRVDHRAGPVRGRDDAAAADAAQQSR